MRTLLICPSERPEVACLSQRLPLSNVPLLGQSLLEYWLSMLALRGAQEIDVLVHDRPEFARQVVGNGERWGLNARVISESRELTAAEASLKHLPGLQAAAPEQTIAVLDHFPGRPEQPLFTTYHGWFAALRSWMPSALTVDRVGANETRPGVWMGCHSRVSPQAELRAPCWIGQHVFVGPRARVGPGAIVEDGSFVESGAELAESWVGPDTFVGQFARITGSLAWGSTLVNWQTDSVAQVADPFLLCALRRSYRHRSFRWPRRFFEFYARSKGEVGLLWKYLLLHKEG